MKENKKKILAAAAFLIAAGLVFGMSQKRSGIWMERLDSKETKTLYENVKDPSGEKNLDRETEWSGHFTEENRADQEKAGYPKEELENTRETVEKPPESLIYVYICGEVINPGVYELSENSRIYEAVEAAGGFTENASEESINLASKVSDGMQIMIFNKEEAALSVNNTDRNGNSWQAGSKNAGRVNLNTASKEELMTLKGIGESKAEDIIRYREKNGKFQKIEDIMKISGIKEAGFEKIRDDITV